MKTKILASSLFVASLLLGSCSDDDNTTEIETNSESTTNTLALSLTGLENLGSDYVYEGWIIVNDSPVSTGIFSVDDNGDLSADSFEIDIDQLAAATNFVLSIEPSVDPDPAPSATKLLIASFDGDTATVTSNFVPGINEGEDADFSDVAGIYFLRTPTDESAGSENNMNDESGIWFGTTAATAGFTGMPELEQASGWRYEGWIVVDGTPLSTGTFTSFDAVDSGNLFSGTENNDGPPIPGEDFLLNAPDGITFPLDLRGKTTVISLEPYPDNSAAPFAIKPLLSAIATDAATAPTTHDFGQNLSSFPSGTISRN